MSRFTKVFITGILALAVMAPMASARPVFVVRGYYGPAFYGPGWYGPSWYGWYGPAWAPYGYAPERRQCED